MEVDNFHYLHDSLFTSLSFCQLKHHDDSDDNHDEENDEDANALDDDDDGEVFSELAQTWRGNWNWSQQQFWKTFPRNAQASTELYAS